MSALGASAIFSLILLASPAAAQTADLGAAIQNNDIGALETAARHGGSQGTLASGVLASLRHQDAAALASLNRAAHDPRLSAPRRRDAFSVLGATYMRENRYADAVAAMEAADAAAPAATSHEAQSAAQSLTFARVLRTTPAMSADVPSQGEAPLRRDLARLSRADVSINGQTQEAVLDTGANFSTIAESAAHRLGLRMLDGDVSVSSSGADAAAAHIAIADTLSFAGATFHSVVFIVFPDSALSFANGAYTIPAIVGLPVLSALGRIEWRMGADGAGVLRHSASNEHWNTASNLLLAGLEPIALVTANGNNVRMTFDSGAGNTSLTPLAATDFPALVEGAGLHDVQVGGAGGVRSYTGAATLAHLAIGVGDQTVNLATIHVVGAADDGVHGNLGQDVLQSSAGYVIDFNAMQFALLRAN